MIVVLGRRSRYRVSTYKFLAKWMRVYFKVANTDLYFRAHLYASRCATLSAYVLCYGVGPMARRDTSSM